MSDKVIVKDFRTTKEFILPVSGVKLTCYSSILLGEIGEISKKESTFETNIELIAKVIKEWNFYLNEADESPLPVNIENMSRLPAPDFEYLVKELAEFSAEQKKS